MKIYTDALVVTMDGEHRVIQRGAVCIDGKYILGVDSTEALVSRWPDAETIDSWNMIILPGFINAHTHLFQVLFRGIGSDFPLSEWLSRIIWPLSSRLGKEECYLGALLASVEMLQCGVTTFVDSHYITIDKYCYDGIARAIEEAGIRGVIGRSTVDTSLAPPEFREEVEEAVDEATRVIETYHNTADGRITVRVEPLNEALASERMVLAMRDLSKRCGVGFSMHTAETHQRVEDCRRMYGLSTIEWLWDMGILGPDVLLAHCVWLTRKEIELLRSTQTKVAHNPVANQYLADGVAPVKEMLDRGVTVAICTDGASSNNDQNILQALKSAILLQRVSVLDASALSASRALKMITIDAAKAIGMESSIGSIEPGKLADLIFLDLNVPQFVPAVSAISNIAFTSPANSVARVVVNGRTVFENGKHFHLDEKQIVKDCNDRVMEIIGKVKLKKAYIFDSFWNYC
ncbi:MAG: hypothetical protein DRP87_04330 [Spirochaetes bacterium]|nr:MAG: hypothetical protein DRP87_04330 [Spirochaetota bacterium]